MVKCLVENDIDINKKDKNGWTPLIYVSNKYPLNVELIKYLVEHGSDINAKDNNNEAALIYIINSRKSKERNIIIKYFIDHGAELNIKDRNGRSILQLANFYCFKTSINYMIEHGAHND